MPIAYVEAFNYFKYAQEKWFGSLDNLKAVMYICYGLTYDELYKNFLMKRKHKNKNLKLIDIQHGGNYGIDCNHLMKVEYEISNLIYTWGFEYNTRNCKTIRMPITKLLNRKVNRSKSDGTILYVSYSYFKDFTMMESSWVLYRHTIENELSFLKKIDNEIRNRIVVRLHPNEKMWGVKENIKSEIQSIKFDSINDFYTSLERCSIVICSDWNTTCIEALCLGYPVIVLKPLDECEVEAKQDAINMKKFGLLYENWEDLLTFVNGLTNAKVINDWWNNKERIQFVNYLKEKYCYNPTNALEIWQNELLKYTNS